MTNVAFLLSLYPEIKSKLEQIVFMGGAVARGNRTPTSEFNIYADPEAAHLVLSHAASCSALHSPFFDDCSCDDLASAHKGEQRFPPVKVVMVPLDVTHTALVTDEVLARIKRVQQADSAPGLRSAAAASTFRQMLADLLVFFEDRYREVYAFDRPPLHDPCAVAYVLHPEWFQGQFVNVDIELQGQKSLGQTICDFYNLQKHPRPNVYLTERMDVPRFWELIYQAVDCADRQSPLNQTVISGQ
jgi:uridine nucleosidase